MDERHTPAPDGARSPRVPHVQVRVGHCHIAVPVDQVQQALPLPAQGLAPLPRRSGALLGVVDVGGLPVPVVALERWLPLQDTGEPAAAQRLLVLQHAGALVAVRVDAVLGVRAVAASAVQRLHQAPDDEELFDAVLPAAADGPALCLLDVARLMRLAQVWCAQAELAPAARAAAGAVSAGGARPGHGAQRFAVFRIGSERWAVAATAVLQVVPVPEAELALGRAGHSWAIGQWRGRKLPLVDISAAREASSRPAAPWMALIAQGPLVLGLTVSACEQLVELAPDAVARTPGDALMAGVALLPGQGRLQVLDVGRLFDQTPGAAISRSTAGTNAAGSAAGPAEGPAEPVPYLVFEADQRYASPVPGVLAVLELPPQARADLGAGRPAFLAWRGQTVRLVILPAIARAAAPPEPLLAVLVQGEAPAPPIGIAIRALCDWLPAHSARRSGMRMGAMGEFGLINAKGALEHTNLVEVDLAQMAHLLG